jgi:hypothetical protein
VRLRVVLAEKPVKDVRGMSAMSTVLAKNDGVIDGICTQDGNEQKVIKWGQEYKSTFEP